MPHEEPVEPSAIYAADGSRVPAPRPAGAQPAVPRTLLPAMVRALTAGPMLTASAFAVAAVAAAKAAGMAGRLMAPAAWRALGDVTNPGSGSAPAGGVQISWTHVEIRWTPER